ncbi:MAG: trans-2-enoyl-CoA reductase family protein [Gemmatimonadetes bacterium]|nr:trans-2-enoyl-CoA reductase family protein [Gemmatimonadota bacterium]
MIIRPKVRGFICVTTHPTGCAANVARQVEHARSHPIADPPRCALVLGSSTSYGLGSRIALAFGGNAATLGVFFDKAPTERRPGTAGWYNTAAFEATANEAGLTSASFNADAFSHDTKARVVEILKDRFPPVDLVVNSVASPRRVHPDTGVAHMSVLKPIGEPYESRSVNTDTGEVVDVSLEPATSEDIANTVAVMGGEDWRMWMDALEDAGVLADGCRTLSYSYIGPEMTWPIYKDGTIGKAKADLHRTAADLNTRLEARGGSAHIAVMKAVVTQSSAAIPVVPLYISILYKVMKEAGDHEGPMEQAMRLFGTKLFGREGAVTDGDGFIRLDDLEMKEATQAAVHEIWPRVNTENLNELSDFEGYKDDFLRLFGFGVEGVDEEADVDPLVSIPNLVE